MRWPKSSYIDNHHTCPVTRRAKTATVTKGTLLTRRMTHSLRVLAELSSAVRIVFHFSVGSGGSSKIVEVSPAGLRPVCAGQWTTDWTAIVPLNAYGRAWYLTYKAVGGTVTINHLCG
jgi:hypothetical protein